MGNDTGPVYAIMWIKHGIESLHNQLKSIYLEEKRTRIIDDFLEILLQ